MRECGVYINGYGHCTLPLHNGHETHTVPVWGQFATAPNKGEHVVNMVPIDWDTIDPGYRDYMNSIRRNHYA